MGKNETRKAWGNIRNFWGKMTVPNRPSLGDCAIYGKLIRRALGEKTNPKIVLMGSTPELRRVLYTFEYLQNAHVYCVDINPDMYGAMSNFIMKFSKPREKFLKRSWLDTKFKDGTFDLIVGDQVIGNTLKEEHHKLFLEISRILKDRGTWIIRHHLYPQRIEKTSGRKILIDLAKKIESGEYDFHYAVNILVAYMFSYAGRIDPNNNTLEGHAKILRREYLPNPAILKLDKIAREIVYIYENNFSILSGDHKWIMLSKNESEKELRKYFKIMGKYQAKDYPANDCSPIYLLRKKPIL